MKTPLVLALCLLFFDIAFSQSRIALVNPSFELDSARRSVTPLGWIDLGSMEDTPPDIFSKTTGLAADGNQFIGMLACDNQNFEGIGQRLASPLKKGATYAFRLWMAHAPDYKVFTSTARFVNYNAPIKLQIWGFNHQTHNQELLAESPAVAHQEWKQYGFALKPQTDDFDELDLIVNYGGEKFGMNGNLLLDHCSDLELMSDHPHPVSAVPVLESSEIRLLNPSFERKGRYRSYAGWQAKRVKGFFWPVLEPGRNVRQDKAPDGKTYMVMLSEAKDLYQSLGQELDQPLLQDSTYEWSVSLSTSSDYQFFDSLLYNALKSKPSMAKVLIPFNRQSLTLSIWGVDESANQYELLAESPPIDHTEWKRYTFRLTPRKSSYRYFSLLVKPPEGKSGPGNIRIDDCSTITIK
ncbi:MAG: hypothetical protein IT269_02735 [Saprospiraceae bacterium]|nr:hypothetical protein [Saprospiraceae bacterium]